jgi:amidase
VVWLDEPFCPPEPAAAALMRAVVAALPGAGPVRESRAPWGAAEFFATHCALMYGALALAAPADTFDYFVRRSAGLDGLPDPVARPTELLAAGLTLRHRDWLAANERRWGFAARLAEVFADADAIICPAAPSPAPLLGSERLDRRRQCLGGRDQPALLQTYWAAIASSLHLPAVTVPVGVDPAGLPVAVQVIAPQRHDRQALAVAARIEQAVGGCRWPPGYG